jgi:transcriptional regulator GlxA family with amidase domain
MKPFNIVIAGFDGALSSAITGALDLFSLAGVTWNYIHEQPTEELFTVSIASVNKQPFRCINHVQLLPHADLTLINDVDLLLVPTIGGNILHQLDIHQAITPEINRLFLSGSKVASNCTGAFLLAEAGILAHRAATTHWGYESVFKKRFPNVNLDTSQLVTHQDGIYCAGGGVAWLDLVLLLIEDFCGESVAEETAKAHVLDLTRTNQRAYTSIQQKTLHGDADIARVQQTIMANYDKPISIEHIASDVGMSQRTLMRRFKQACDETPLQYLQSVRIHHACKLLETTTLSVESIVYKVGYSDSSTFVQLFKRWMGISPHQYRIRRTE